jgi:hypothetical protein
VIIVLFEYISDRFGGDRIGKDIVDEIGSLNSIVKLPNSDLMNDKLFIMREELG